uniref:Zinc finger, C2H2 type n=1 Tax=Steinernema glaseri TaxID=37863 RepID=A0A1I7ZPB2_9BILA
MFPPFRPGAPPTPLAAEMANLSCLMRFPHFLSNFQQSMLYSGAFPNIAFHPNGLNVLGSQSNTQDEARRLQNAHTAEHTVFTWVRGRDPRKHTCIRLRCHNEDKEIDDALDNSVTSEHLSFVCVTANGRRFVSVFCDAPDGLPPNSNIEIPPKWRPLCRQTSGSLANVATETTTKQIGFGDEIVLCRTSSISSIVKSESEVELSEDLSMNTESSESSDVVPVVNSVGLLEEMLIAEGEEDPEAVLASSDDSPGYPCERCGKVFSYSYYREKHLKYTRCVDKGDRKYPCPLCSRSFEKRDRLRIHVLHVHENHRPHVCSVCGKAFSQSSSLNKHLRVHSGERPYKCTFCTKSFTASSILRTHIRQHSGEKPFKCSICGKSFASHAAHDSHVRRAHSANETHRYKCAVCDKFFEHESHLAFHVQCVHVTVPNVKIE